MKDVSKLTATNVVVDEANCGLVISQTVYSDRLFLIDGDFRKVK
jgi:hypothetical protein